MPDDERRDEASKSTKTGSKVLFPEFVRNGFAGAASGAISRMVTAPLDVAKIRFQLDHGAAPRYDKSVWAAIRSVYAEEGLVSLWRGNIAAMFLWTTFAGIQFGTFEHLRSMDLLRRNAADRSVVVARNRTLRLGATRDGAEEGGGDSRAGSPGGVPGAVSHFVYGSIAGCAGTVASYPFDITRTALAFQGVPKRYPSTAAFVTRTVQEAGPKGLFRGMTPALAMVAPQMGVSFAVYELVKGIPRHRRAVSCDRSSAGRGAGVGERSGQRTRRGAAGGDRGVGGDGEVLAVGGRRVDAVSGCSDPARGRDGGETATQRGGALGGVGGSHQGGALDGLIETAWPLVAGAVAGMTSKLAVFPLDTVKKRVQTEVMLTRDIAYGVLPKYSGPLDAFRTILVEEGALALFRGSVPAMWKSGASTAITFAVYEWVKAALAVD